MDTKRYWLNVSYYNGKKKSFDDCKTYNYYVDIPADKAQPAPGAFLVLVDPVAYDALKVVRVNRVYLTKQDAVRDIMPDDELFIHKEFVGYADVGGYFGREAARERIKELSERLRVLVERAEKLAVYKKLAETDPEVRVTLDAMAELAREYDVPLDL